MPKVCATDCAVLGKIWEIPTAPADEISGEPDDVNCFPPLSSLICPAVRLPNAPVSVFMADESGLPPEPLGPPPNVEENVPFPNASIAAQLFAAPDMIREYCEITTAAPRPTIRVLTAGASFGGTFSQL